jgi:hypothetical protein
MSPLLVFMSADRGRQLSAVLFGGLVAIPVAGCLRIAYTRVPCEVNDIIDTPRFEPTLQRKPDNTVLRAS